jgi:hypothetical protein
MVLELPERQLLRAVISVSGVNIGSGHSLVSLATLADKHFSDWTINVLACDHLTVVVGDDLSGDDIDAFCDQVVAELSACCSGVLLAPDTG